MAFFEQTLFYIQRKHKTEEHAQWEDYAAFESFDTPQEASSAFSEHKQFENAPVGFYSYTYRLISRTTKVAFVSML